MSYHYLSTKRNTTDIPVEYTYLVISKYTDNSFKPSNGKKLTSQELKDKRNVLELQEKTIKQLDSGYYNLYNNRLKLESIFNSSFINCLYDDNYLVYKIEPISSNKETSGTYYSRTEYLTSEFNVESQLKTKEDIIKQIYNDGLLRKFSAEMFDNLSYGNEGYQNKLYEHFKYINDSFTNYNISLSDIMLTDDYKHELRSKFCTRDISEITKTNIRYLLHNDLILCFKEADYYKQELIINLIKCGLYDIALKCVTLLEDWEIAVLKDDKDFDIVLRKWSSKDEIKEIIKFLHITLNGVRLNIIRYSDYNTTTEIEDFTNINEVKTYIIKNYDVTIEDIMNKDIADLEVYDKDSDDVYYKFEIN